MAQGLTDVDDKIIRKAFATSSDPAAVYGNFDIGLDHLSGSSQLHPAPYAPGDVLY